MQGEDQQALEIYISGGSPSATANTICNYSKSVHKKQQKKELTMNNRKRVAKTAAGVMAGAVAVESFRSAGRASTATDKAVLFAVGSIAAAASYHLLRDEVVNTAGAIGYAVHR